MTAEKYLLMYKKIWAAIRHDMWKEIEDKKKADRVEKLERKDIAKIHHDVHERFETIRTEIYAKVMEDENITQKQAKRYMQMCYATHASISSMSTADDSEAKLSLWPTQVRQVSREHTKLCNEIMSGKYYKTIEIDPRENIMADEKTDLKSLSAYKPGLSSQQTMLPNDKVRVKAASKSVDQYVDKMIKWAQDVQRKLRAPYIESGEAYPGDEYRAGKRDRAGKLIEKEDDQAAKPSAESNKSSSAPA